MNAEERRRRYSTKNPAFSQNAKPGRASSVQDVLYARALQATQSSINLKDLGGELQIGDVLLFRGKKLGQGCIRFCLFCSWDEGYDHVAVVVPHPLARGSKFDEYKDRVMLLEATYFRGITRTDFIFNFHFHGLWGQYCHHIAFRKLKVERTREMFDALQEFCDDVEQHGSYEKDFSQIAKAYLNVEQESGTESGFFCSELVAEAYKRMGLLPDTVTSNKFLPGDFASSVFGRNNVDDWLVEGTLQVERKVELGVDYMDGQVEGALHQTLQKMWKTEQDLMKKHRAKMRKTGEGRGGKKTKTMMNGVGERKEKRKQKTTERAKAEGARAKEKQSDAIVIRVAEPSMARTRTQKKRARFQTRKNNYEAFTSLDSLVQSSSDSDEDDVHC